MIGITTESTTPLAGNGVATGASHSVLDNHIDRFRASVYADQAGTLAIQQSADGATNWATSTSQATTASQVTVLESIPGMQYVRAVFTNGATPNTVFVFTTCECYD